MMLSLVAAASVSAIPQAHDIERNLQAREFCFTSIDACLDEAGNQVIPTSRFKVSDVSCRPVGKLKSRGYVSVKSSMRCRFRVEATSWINEQQVGSAQVSRDAAIFDLRGFDAGRAGQVGSSIEYSWHQRVQLRTN